MSSQVMSTIVGVFESNVQAQNALRELLNRGFAKSDIGVAYKNQETGEVTEATLIDDPVAAGATTGAIAGLSAGALWGIGIAAGVLPAIGPIIAGGTLAAIAASAATGAAAAGIAGALVGAGVSDVDADFFEDEFNRGRILLTVHTDSRQAEAENVIVRFNGVIRGSRVY